MLLAPAWALAWLVIQQLGPTIPPLELHTMAPRPGGQADAIDDLVEAPPAKATAILFKGGFSVGGTASLTAALDAAPGVRTIVFDSPGGRVGVADGIATLIRDRHLATAVTRYCASACTVAYVAGRPRLASRKAVFAFHLGSGPILTDLVAQAAVSIERPWFVRGGVSLAFTNRALHAPNQEPYRARLSELVAAGYVQRVVPPLPGNGAEPGLGQQAGLLAAIGALEPETRRTLVWEHESRVAMGMTAADSADLVELWSGLVVNRWLGRTSDQAASGFIDATVAAMDALGAAQPTGCMQWQVGILRQAAGFRAIPAELRSRLRQAQVTVLQDAKARPNPVPAERDALSQANQAVRQAVLAQYGERSLIVAATPEHAFDDPARSCAAEAAYLRGLRDRPEGGRLVRWALAAG